jgi:hypothetical protein
MATKRTPIDVVKELGGKFSPNIEAWIAGAEPLICVLCSKGPCVCGPCPGCGWHGAPGNCRAC